MGKFLDVVFWFFNNPEKVNKVWIIVAWIGLIILIGVAGYMLLSIPEVVKNSITGG